MARTLDGTLDLLQLQPQRRPRWLVEIYDIRSGGDTINDIVREQTLNALTGPRDFTSYVVTVEITETAGTFIDTGVPTSSLAITVSDPNGLFDYFNLFADPTGDGRWLRRDNVIRVKQGDADIAASKWPYIFTGFLVGQAGIDRNRTTGRSIITMEAVGRESRFVKSKITSQVFGDSVTFLSAAQTIAQADMNLTGTEIDLAGWGAQTFGHTANQFVDQEPMVSLAQLMMIDGFMPKFDGTGVLTQVQGSATASPARIYSNDDIIRSVVQPFSNENPVNSVCVIGLDKDMTKISQPRQEIQRIELTTGYFARDETTKFFWSKDRTALADNVEFIIEQSINGVTPWGTQEFSTIPTPGSGEGTIGGKVKVGTGYAPFLLVHMAAEYIGLAFIPDAVTTVGFVAGGGETISIGRASQAVLMVAIMGLMSQIGRAVYRVDGTPFEYVFKEIRACAELENLLTEDIVAAEVENHLVNTQTDADNLARDLLFQQQARGRPRSIRMLPDLRLEPDDTIELANSRRYLIDSITRILARVNEEITISIRAFETTPGIGALV